MPERVDCSARLPANDLATRDRETRRQEAASAHVAIASRARRVAIRDPMSDSLPLASSIIRHYDNSRRARALVGNKRFFVHARIHIARQRCDGNFYRYLRKGSRELGHGDSMVHAESVFCGACITSWHILLSLTVDMLKKKKKKKKTGKKKRENSPARALHRAPTERSPRSNELLPRERPILPEQFMIFGKTKGSPLPLRPPLSLSVSLTLSRLR